MKKLLLCGILFIASHISAHHFIISTPKSGTYLTIKMTSLILGKPVQFYDIPGQDYYNVHRVPDSQELVISHPYPALDLYCDQKDPRIVVIRDIRDAIVSLYFFIEKHKYGPAEYNELSKHDKIMYLIYTDIPYMSLKFYTDQANKWLNQPRAQVLRFEEMVGEKGGGSRIKQRRSIKRLCAFLGVKRSEAAIDYVVENLFGGTMTFHKGEIGAWKEHFTKEHLEAFNHVFSHTMKEWGYYD